MNEIKAIIVEDEPRNSNSLKKLLARYCTNVVVVDTAQTVSDAVQSIAKNEPDLVFLDVELPDGTGFNVIEQFPDNVLNVIFVTAFEHYAIRAIKSSALDYLLKPVDVDDLVLAVNRLQTDAAKPGMQKRRENLLYNSNQHSIGKQRIAVPTTDSLRFIKLEDIIQCQAEGSYTLFHITGPEKVLASKPLTYFEEILDEEVFQRSHQSHLVNINHITKYIKGRGGYLVMSDGSKVEVSVRMKTEFLDKLL